MVGKQEVIRFLPVCPLFGTMGKVRKEYCRLTKSFQELICGDAIFNEEFVCL